MDIGVCPSMKVILNLLVFFDFLMNRAWNILCWNVRGINAAEKWANNRNKIDESNCEIFCFQETKKENFDSLPREILVSSFLPHLLAPLGVLLWAGMAVYLMVL